MRTAKNDPNASRERGPKMTLYHKGLSYRVTVRQIASNSLDFDQPLVCPYCGHKLVVTTELISFGQKIDRHTYTFLCKRELIGFMYLHSIDHEESEA